MATKAVNVPKNVILRLPVYLRLLENLRDSGVQTVSSFQIGELLDLNPAQIRKDLAWFGDFGHKGIGYDAAYLVQKIRQILRLDRRIPVALVGAGRLGTALCLYPRVRMGNLPITCVFDNDPARIGSCIGTLEVHADRELEPIIARDQVRMALITVPAQGAQTVADRLVAAGILGILNFAPTSLRVPPEVHVRNADFISELESLAYYVPE